MEILEPKLAAAGAQPVGKVVVGTVKGDLHDIGKNLVAMMLQGGGFEVIDLGTDVPAEKFVAVAKEKGAGLIGMSALLTTTMPYMAQVVQAAKASGVKVKTMIGGAPVTQSTPTRSAPTAMPPTPPRPSKSPASSAPLEPTARRRFRDFPATTRNDSRCEHRPQGTPPAGGFVCPLPARRRLGLYLTRVISCQ